MDKKIIFSAIQPTGTFTLGNYLGALQNWVSLQDEYNCCYSIANMHALTVRQQAKDLRANTLNAYALLLAVGVDPQKSIAFIQSHVKCHAELNWVLSCYTQFGELSRMTQFKDKSARHPENVNAGLFTYPVLMAGDILLYQADFVPVGIDQKQHLELARNIAQRFNGIYGDVFTVPDGYYPKLTAKVMSLQDPTKKMSKSDDNPKSYITILDPPETIVKKIKSAVTDSEALVAYREGKDGVNNLMSIYSAVTGRTLEQITEEFAGHGYGDFKQKVGDALAESLRPIRERYAQLMKDRAYLEECYRDGARKAEGVSQRTLDKVYKKIGFLAR
ncbi:MAG: tryptophan--tRNA ligase [Anaerotruncus sp.]|nr:tryptophan--tRNA ligase [Anaerotruncus sp.]